MMRDSLGKIVHTVKRAGTYAAKVPPQELHKIAVHVRAVSFPFLLAFDDFLTIRNPEPIRIRSSEPTYKQHLRQALLVVYSWLRKWVPVRWWILNSSQKRVFELECWIFVPCFQDDPSFKRHHSQGRSLHQCEDTCERIHAVFSCLRFTGNWKYAKATHSFKCLQKMSF